MRYDVDALLTRKSVTLSLPFVLLFLNVIDVLTTGWGLSHGLQEINPLFSFGVIPLKFLGCSIIGYTSYLQYQLNSNAKAVNVVILIIVFAYLAVVVNNFYRIFQVLVP
jgi:hypothetical protein